MNDLRDFHRFLGDQLAHGGTETTPEECLDLWRAEHPRNDELAADVQAVREALADREAGDSGQPIEEFLAEYRARSRSLS